MEKNFEDKSVRIIMLTDLLLSTVKFPIISIQFTDCISMSQWRDSDHILIRNLNTVECGAQ